MAEDARRPTVELACRAITANLCWREDDASATGAELVGRFTLGIAVEAAGANQPFEAIGAACIEIGICRRLQAELLVGVFFFFVGVAAHTVQL